MKRQIKETTILGKRGYPQRVITYGYDTKVPGLDVIRVIGDEREFCIVQRSSGLSLGTYSAGYTKLVRFANKHLKDFDFKRNTTEIQADRSLMNVLGVAMSKPITLQQWLPEKMDGYKMIKTKRILAVKELEHAVTFKMVNNGGRKMTTQEIRKQINMQKMHNARTKRAFKNIDNDEKLLARYGGMYTQAEINLHFDLYPHFRVVRDDIESEIPDEAELVELLDQLGMYAKCVQEDNQFII